jgi:uncharacterized membrane protein
MSTRDAAASIQARQRADVIDLLSGSIAVLLLLLVIAGEGGVARALLAFLFTFFVPGRAIVSNWRRMADWSDIGMSIALSIGLLAFLATVSLWAKFWHPIPLFEVEAAASLVGLGVAFTRRRRTEVTPRGGRPGERLGKSAPF